MTYQTISVDSKEDVLWCKLNRPEVRNAFNAEMIRELTDFAESVNEDVRAVVLCGEGNLFCAGGDLRWMQGSLDFDHAENLEDARKLARMYFALDRLPAPLIGIVHRAAMGGGVGLVAVCDYAIATKDTQFSFSEVRLGIVPACIAPFVLRKIGPGHARALFITAEKFAAAKALEIGLIHHVAQDREEATAWAQKKLAEIAQCGPAAIRAAKKLVFDLLQRNSDSEQLETAAQTLAALRVSEEGQEGLRAFLEKRKPRWIK